MHVVPGFSIPKQRSMKNGNPRQRKPSRFSSNSGKMVSAPVAFSRRRSTTVPVVRQDSNCARIVHEEYFADVVSTGTPFAVTSYPIQPAVGTIFPWLSTIAQRYESYRFNKLCFLYKTQAATTAVGTVLMAVDYDPQDAAPVTKQQALSYRGAVRGAPWDSFELCCDSRDVNKLPQRFTRAGSVSLSDLKTFDVGNLHVCVQGVAAATVGELYVKYEVELYTPQVGDSIGGYYTTVGAGEAAAAWFGSAGPDVLTGMLPFTKTSNSTLTFNQAFEGIIYAYLNGTVMTADVAWGGTATTSVVAQLANAASTAVICVGRVRAAVGQTIAPSLTATTLTGVQIFVAPGPYAYLG